MRERISTNTEETNTALRRHLFFFEIRRVKLLAAKKLGHIKCRLFQYVRWIKVCTSFPSLLLQCQKRDLPLCVARLNSLDIGRAVTIKTKWTTILSRGLRLPGHCRGTTVSSCFAGQTVMCFAIIRLGMLQGIRSHSSRQSGQMQSTYGLIAIQPSGG